jgi:hypothetical protein
MKLLTKQEWEAEGTRLFGPDKLQWQFKCPVCGFVASVQDWKDAGAGEGAVAFSCIGRHKKKARKAFEECGPGPCNYAGGGLFRMNPVSVMDEEGNRYSMFEFAYPEESMEAKRA